MSREFPKNNPPKITAPTVGRIVHVFGLEDEMAHPDTPRAGLVAGVVDGLTINVFVVNYDGSCGGLQDLHHASERTGSPLYWDWMEYQKGQAAKNDELDKRIEEMKAGHKTSNG